MNNQFEKSKVGCYDFFAMPFHCDFNNSLRIDYLGNDMLNAADLHSDTRGFGMNYLNSIGKTWVLSRLAIEVLEMPKSYERLQVETWVESAMRYFTKRNFAVRDSAGRYFAYGRSVWAMINTDDRQPADLFTVRDGLLKEYVEADKPCPIEGCSRAKIDDNAEVWRTVEMRYSDIDINGHVNSVKYIEHVINLWSIDWYRSHCLKRLDVAYIAESHEGDTLSFYVGKQSDDAFAIKICNGETEVCRCKVIF